jgi:hypothetical protein
MKNNFKILSVVFALFFIINSCTKKDYTLGELTAPTNLVITTEVVGKDATHPNGDGSGDVKISVTANNALSYKVDYNAKDAVELVYLPTGKITKKYTDEGVNTYRITAVAYGPGGTSTLATTDVTVRSDFSVDPAIVSKLTGGSSKTWAVDKGIPSHFGVGPWNVASIRPEWYSAAPNEKETCCKCFYTATFTFTKVAASGTYSLTVASPDGAFTKTGALANLPGIPASGDEGCYSYGGGTSGFSFVRASSNAPVTPSRSDNSPTTQTSIVLAGNNTFIGYGSVLKEYEILTITPTTMYLRVQGTETGNAWYLKLKSL